jgi:hypothetical protein
MEDRVHRPGQLTVAEFDRFVDVQWDERDWELVDGDVVMMTNPTENHIVLVYQDQMRVEHYRREAEGRVCDVLTAPDHVLRFEAVEFEIALDRVYFDVPVLRPITGG